MVKHDKNLSQINSSAPMAIASQNDFVAHDKQAYPLQPVYPGIRKKGRCVKVILNSGDRQTGSSLTSAKFLVNLPTEFIAKRLNLIVDSLIVSTAPNSVSNLSLYPYYIRIPEYRNHLSYNSTTGTTSGMILLTTGTQYQNNSPRETGGGTLIDPTLFQRPITIEFYSPHFDVAATNGVANAWSIQISLWDAGDD